MNGFVQIENRIDSIIQKLDSGKRRFYKCFQRMDEILTYLSQHYKLSSLVEVTDGLWHVVAEGYTVWIRLKHYDLGFSAYVSCGLVGDPRGLQIRLLSCSRYVEGQQNSSLEICAQEIGNCFIDQLWMKFRGVERF